MDHVVSPALQDIPTPFVKISLERLTGNIARAHAKAAEMGASIRPNYKTHRTEYITNLQMRYGAVGFTCATFDQAEYLLSTGASDVFVACTVIVDSSNLVQARRLVRSGRIIFGVCNVTAVDRLSEAMVSRSARIKVALEIDTGGARTGVSLDELRDLAQAAVEHGMRVVSLFSYPGDGYWPGESAAAARREAQGLEAAANLLRDAGFNRLVLSAGSTPTFRHAAPAAINEYRLGTYVFGDRQQMALGSADASDVALSVVATVVDARRGELVLDAGGKALGRDAPTWVAGYGSVAGAEISRIFDHHAIVPGVAEKIGARVDIIPNNANSVVSLHDHLWIQEEANAFPVPVRRDR